MKTVGDIPLPGAGFSWAAFFGGFVLAAALGGGVLWYQGHRYAAAVEDARAAAAADSLEILQLSEHSQEAERRARIAQVEADIERELKEEALASLERQRLRPRAVVTVETVAVDTLYLEGGAAMAGDTLEVHASHSDSTFQLGVDVGVTGVTGDPRLAYARADIMARILQQMALSCGEDDAPHVSVFTFDSRITVEQMESIVHEGVGCWPKPPPFLSIKGPTTVREVALAILALFGWAR